MNIEIIVFVALILVIALFFVDGIIFLWLSKLFKIENPTYKNSLKILIFSGLASVIANIIFSIINLGILSTLLVTIASFFIFHHFLKRYYQNSWKKSLGIYAVFGIINALIGLSIVIPTRLYVFEPFMVAGETMLPTYKDKDYLFINKFDKLFTQGDIIVFRYPKNPEQFFIKRIVGLPSEKVDIRGGKIYINGQVLSESYYNGNTNGEVSITLGEDEYYLLGDNRNKSFDSRAWGPVTRDLIIGKVF